ncbi:MAG: PulJ/GspJ family protein [Dethiobacteria bacterium]
MFERVKITIKDCRGITLAELLVALSLLTIVAVAIFNFLGFSQRSWHMANNEAAVTSEAQLLLMHVERDIRSARRGSQGQPGVKILNNGRGLRIHNFMDGEEKIIEYALQSDNVLRRKVSTPAGEAVTETEYENIYQDVDEYGQALQVFSISGDKVELKLLIGTSQGHFSRKLEVDTTFTIRSKEVL